MYSFLSIIPHPPKSTLFPYTTLFRSRRKSKTTTPPAPRPRRWRPPDSPIRIAQKYRAERFECDIEDSPKPAPSDRKSTRLNSSHTVISYAVFCLKKKKKKKTHTSRTN